MKNKLEPLTRPLFNFFLQPASLSPVVFLRVAFGLFNLILLLNLYPYRHDLYGPTGYVQWIFADDFFVDHMLPSIQFLYDCLPSFVHISADQFVLVLFIIQFICFAAITVGLYSNLFSIAGWLLHLAFLNTGIIYGYGVESIIHIVLFYFIFMPLDAKFSLLNVIKRPTILHINKQVHARLFIRVLQLHLCIIYLDAGVAKILGSHWWNGEAVWRSFTQFPFNNFTPTILYKFPALLKFAGWVVVAAEILYCVFIWNKLSRTYMLSVILFMHTCIGLIMGLHFFAIIMIIVNIAAFGFNLQIRQHKLMDNTTVKQQLTDEPYRS